MVSWKTRNYALTTLLYWKLQTAEVSEVKGWYWFIEGIYRNGIDISNIDVPGIGKSTFFTSTGTHTSFSLVFLSLATEINPSL